MEHSDRRAGNVEPTEAACACYRSRTTAGSDRMTAKARCAALQCETKRQPLVRLHASLQGQARIGPISNTQQQSSNSSSWTQWHDLSYSYSGPRWRGTVGKWDARWARITYGSATTCGAPVLLIKMINWAQNEAENGRERERMVALLQAQLNSESSQVNVDIVLPHATCNLSLPASVLFSLMPPFASILCVPLLLLCFYIRHKYC